MVNKNQVESGNKSSAVLDLYYFSLIANQESRHVIHFELGIGYYITTSHSLGNFSLIKRQ